MTIGYTRARWGRGFTYRNPAGDTVTDVETRAWLQGLAIPPAWEEVEIAADPDSDVLATGRDAAGRKQFLYHPDFRARQEKAKFERIVGFAERLEKMRRVTGQHLRRQAGDRKLALACMVRLLDLAYAHCGVKPTLLERDFNFPPMAELFDELAQIRAVQARHVDSDAESMTARRQQATA